MKSALCCLLLVIALTNLVSAEVVLDQEFMVDAEAGWLGYYLDYPGDYLAQTFTVRDTGELAGIGVQVTLYTSGSSPHAPPIDDLHLKVVRTDVDGLPLIDDVVAAGTIGPAGLPTAFAPGPLADVDLGNWHAVVTAGERLAITFSSDQTDHSGPSSSTDYLWIRAPQDEHPGGEFSIYSPQLYGPTPLRDLYVYPGVQTMDAGFRVYVDTVPEPDSLLVGGLLALLVIGRRAVIGN